MNGIFRSRLLTGFLCISEEKKCLSDWKLTVLVELGDVGWAGLLHQTVRGGWGPTQETVPHRGAAVTSYPPAITSRLAVVGNVATAL